MALEAGSRLGPYEIVGLLGSGGMGEVYRARDPRLGREVAIKVLPLEIADPKRLRRFEQEARAAGALNHPNVLDVHDIGTQEGVAYVVSELLEGQTLRARLEGGALPVGKALDYALQIVHGLAAAHDKGIVHRDLKPENVFVTEDGRVKILDFGLAKLRRPGPLGEGDKPGESDTTESGVILGTVGYMSPEQVRGEAADHRSDIFSFGAVLYEMLSGSRAFRRPSAAETMNAILKEDPAELTWTGSGIPSGLVRIARRCLEKRAGERFRSAHDLSLALETISSETSRSVKEGGVASNIALMVDVAKHHRKALLAMLTAAVVLAAGGLYRDLVPSPAPPAGDAITSVAVLPFENVGGDPDSEYLSDGVAESLIDKLSQLPNLKVIARATSFRFRGDDVDPQKVGRDLGVGAVVSGRVSLRGDSLVIGAELVDVAGGAQLWGERYKTGMGDIFAVEEDIAGDISRGLRLKLAPRDEALPTRHHTAAPEAYQLYLLSRFEFNKRTHEGYKKALAYAQQAIRKDRAYAPAYAALAMAYAALGNAAQLSNREANSKARTAATKALAIAESLPEAHRTLAWVHFYLDWDWAGADREFQRAIELNPNSADAESQYSSYLVTMGRFEDGIAHARRAVELDPLTPWLRRSIGWAYYFARRYDQALETYRGALEFDPGLGFHFELGWIYREKGMYEDAIAEFRKYLDENPGDAFTLGHLGNTYARAGRVREAREIVRELKERLKDEKVGKKVGVYEVSFIYAGLGEKDQAFEWLEKAYAERDQGLVYIKVDPTWDPLRSDPRFEELLRRMNFPP